MSAASKCSRLREPTTMAAARQAVTRVAHAPALTRSKAWRAVTGRERVHSTSRGRKTRSFANRRARAVALNQDLPISVNGRFRSFTLPLLRGYEVIVLD